VVPVRGASASFQYVAATLVVATCFAACSCGDDAVDLPQGTMDVSEHFVVHRRAADRVCPATIEALEQNFASAQRTLGFEWTRGRKIAYYLYLDAEDVKRSHACPAERPACANRDGSAVYTWLPFHRHELIHAYLAEAGQPHEIYAEGMAEVFRCESGPIGRPESEPWQEALYARKNGGFAAYDAAMKLVRRIIGRFGIEKTMDMYRRSRPGLGPDDFAKEFQVLTGVDLDEFWAEANQNAAVPICFCDGVRVVDGAGDVAVRTCDLGDPQREAVFELNNDSTIKIEGEARLPSSLTVRRCGMDLESDRMVVTPGLESRGVVIAPAGRGRYFVSSLDRVRVEVAENPPATCEAAFQYDMAPGTRYNSINIVGHAAGDFFVKLGTAEPRVVLGTNGAGRVCRACSSQTECSSPSEAFKRGASIQGDYVLTPPPGGSLVVSFE